MARTFKEDDLPRLMFNTSAHFPKFATQSIITLLTISATVFGTPVSDRGVTHNLAMRGTILTGPSDSESVANRHFLLKNNLWGKSADPSGTQNSQVTQVNGNIVTWQTSYTWGTNPKLVKSFADLDLTLGVARPLSSISSLPTSWQWSYTAASPALISDVAYDLWLSNTALSTGASSDSTYEIMIWLSARGGAYPAGTKIGTANVNGVNWYLYKGTMKTWTIFTFLAPTEISDFNSDLKSFFTYLTSTQNVPSSQFLVQHQAGTEVLMGNATLTSTYAASII